MVFILCFSCNSCGRGPVLVRVYSGGDGFPALRSKYPPLVGYGRFG